MRGNELTRQKRTKILNDDMRGSVPSICLERARLVTESYRSTEGDPWIVRRAKALAHILRNMTIFIRPEELIVGNHASQQRFVPLYPETGPFSEKELELMPVRKVDTIQITGEQKNELLGDIYPWWKGRCLEDFVLARMPGELRDIVQSSHSVFDVLSRTRSVYGHYLPDISRVINKGFESIVYDKCQAVFFIFLHDLGGFTRFSEDKSVYAPALLAFRPLLDKYRRGIYPDSRRSLQAADRLVCLRRVLLRCT
jgi:pyruvate-formate lyase